ncbi:hypothetical protein [Halobacillus mangrovi]|uniref:Uncharacterized protein n=1 Tax=Halobacillus mangrovi TaxID=402384 RepID=A0A1W5ZTZ6_9BACI|nr:hypothetical protein [Halobacillus mangrovi]ARI76759.1 hypothetical protein HM131_07840 [Halobacillus mangrovi]
MKSVLDTYHLDFPYRKVVLAPELSFQHTFFPYHTDYIGNEQYDDWLKDKRKVKSPLKHKQLKAAEVLLKHSQTTYVKRPAWDVEKGLMEE